MDTNEFEKLQDLLDSWAYVHDKDFVADFLRSKGFRFADGGIDDGLEVEGEYLMYETYSIQNFDVIIYYATTDYIVSYIDYRE